jgi:type I restriction enzyme S subunit
MAKENKNAGKVPNLRFPGFEGEWEKKKLGDIGDVKMCKRIFSEETTLIGDIPFFKIGSFGKEADAFISKELYLDYRKRFSFPKKGDILISASGTVGRTVVFRGEDAYFQDSNIVWIDNDNKNVSNDFLFFILQIVKYNTEGGTIQRLYNSILKSTKFSSPAISEQNKISDFLILIYKRIATQNKIIGGLRSLKSSVTVKIFSQEIRFNDEIDIKFGEWEERKFGEISDIKRGASPRPISNPIWFDKNCRIGWVRISDVTKSNKYLEKTEQYLSREGILKSRLVRKDNIIMSICATIGKPIYTKFDVCIHDGFVVFENPKINTEFLYYYLDYIQLNWYKYGQPGTQVNLNSEIVANENIPLPCLAEQQEIAKLLSSIDTKIDIENQLLQKLEDQKKFLLANLFI